MSPFLELQEIYFNQANSIVSDRSVIRFYDQIEVPHFMVMVNTFEILQDQESLVNVVLDEEKELAMVQQRIQNIY